MTDKDQAEKSENSSKPQTEMKAQPEQQKAEPGKAQEKQQEKPAKPAAKHSRRSHAKHPGLFSRIPWLSTVAIIGVVALGMQMNSKLSEQKYDTEEMLDKLQQQLKTQSEAAAQKLELQQQALRQASAELERLQTQLNSEQARGAQERLDLEAKIKQVQIENAAKGKDPLRWRVAEVDYLLALANHRLMLSHDVKTARTALLDADKRLRQIADPGLNAVRMALADEIKSLDSVEQPDIAGMANQLTALVSGIEQLPLTNRDYKRETLHADIDKKVSTWRELPKMLWQEVSGLIKIRRHDKPIEPLLPPDEKHYLAQNLGLKLEQARLALLRSDEEVFHANISDTRTWVERYFDNKVSSVQTVMDTLTTLEQARLKPDLPDISKSLRELRAWRQARGATS